MSGTLAGRINLCTYARYAKMGSPRARLGTRGRSTLIQQVARVPTKASMQCDSRLGEDEATVQELVPSLLFDVCVDSPRNYDGRAFPASRAVGVSILLNDDEEDWDKDRTSDDEDRVLISVPTLPPM